MLVPLEKDSFSAVKKAVSVDARELTSSNAEVAEMALFLPPLDLGRYEEGEAICMGTDRGGEGDRLDAAGFGGESSSLDANLSLESEGDAEPASEYGGMPGRWTL